MAIEFIFLVRIETRSPLTKLQPQASKHAASANIIGRNWNNQRSA